MTSLDGWLAEENTGELLLEWELAKNPYAEAYRFSCIDAQEIPAVRTRLGIWIRRSDAIGVTVDAVSGRVYAEEELALAFSEALSPTYRALVQAELEELTGRYR